jgi:hypothetical protein
MGVFGDERAQAIQVGAVLIFAIIIIFLSTYQAFVVPNQNEEIEFNHNQEAQQQMTDLRSNIILMPGSSSTRAASVDLGVRYPSRALFVNPGPASGSLRTVATEDSEFNLTLDNAEAVENERETGDFWNGTAVTYNTGAIEFRPGYNLYQNAPRTMYEHSVLYNNFTREGVTQAVTDQTLIDGKQISLIAINGSMSESRVGTVSMDFDPISTRSRTVEVNNTGGPITLSLVTGMNRDEWKNATLDEEMVKNGGYVQSVNVSSGGPDGFNILNITLQPNERYQLELAKVGVGTGATETSAVYLTDVEGAGTTVQEGSTKQLVVEARDKFNVPQSDITIDGAATRGTLSSLSVNSNTEGQAVFQYEAPEDIDGQTSVTGQVNLTIDGNPDSGSFNGSKPENIDINVTVENTDGSGLGGGGGSGGPYNISFDKDEINNTQGLSCNDSCVYDLADDPDGEFSLRAVTDPTVAGAEVDFALNTTASGDFTSASDTETGEDGKADGVFDVTDTGEIRAYVTSGGSGDTIDINLTDSGTLPVFSAFQPDPEAIKDTDGEFIRVYFPIDEQTDGWTIEDGDGQVTNLPDDTLQGEVYFARNSTAFADQWDIDQSKVYTLNTFLNNQGEAMKLNDSDGNIIDEAAYEDGGSFSTTNGWSIDVGKTEVGVRNQTGGGYIDTNNASDWRVETESDFFGEFTVSIDSYDDSVDEGDDVTVTATIQNTGEVNRTQDVDLNVDPNQNGTFTTENTTSLTLSGGESDQVTLTYPTEAGDSPKIDISVATEDNTANETVTVNLAGATSGVRVTDIVPNASAQMQMFNFTVSEANLRKNEKVVINLTEAQATSPIQVDYTSASVNEPIDDGADNSLNIDENSGITLLNYTADNKAVPVGTEVSIRLTSVNAGELGDQSGPYTIPFNRTDTGSSNSTSFRVSAPNGTSELGSLNVTDLTGTGAQEQTIKFSPQTDMVKNENGPEVTIDLSKAGGGNVDYSSASASPNTGEADRDGSTDTPYVKYNVPDGGISKTTTVEITLTGVQPTNTGDTYQVGFSRGTADTDATTFAVNDPPAGGFLRTRATSILPNTDGQSQQFVFGLSEDMAEDEVVVINLTEAQQVSPERVDYDDDSTVWINRSGDLDSNIDENSGELLLNLTAQNDLSAGDAFRVNVTGIAVGAVSNQDNPYDAAFRRTDATENNTAAYEVARDSGIAEIQGPNASSLAPDETGQNQTLSFTLGTDLGEGELVSIDLSDPQNTSGTTKVDYQNVDKPDVELLAGSGQIDSITTGSDNTYLHYRAGGADDADDTIKINLTEVDTGPASAQSNPYEIGFSRGDADTISASFDVENLVFDELNNGTSGVTNFSVTNTGSGSVEITDFEINASALANKPGVANGFDPELTITPGSGTKGEANNQGKGGSFKADGSKTHSLDTNAVIDPGSDAEIDIRFLENKSGNRLSYNLSRTTVPSEGDVNVTLILSDGTERTFYFAGSALNKGNTIVYEGLESVEGDNGQRSGLPPTQVQALGPPEVDLTGNGLNDMPYIKNGNVYIDDTAGNTKKLVDSGHSSNPYYAKTLLGSGTWNGSDPSVFYVDQNNDKIYRVNASGDVTEVADPANGAQGVVGTGDVDDDVEEELIFIGGSQEIRYINPGESSGTMTKVTTTTPGSNNGIGVGQPPDFDGDGKVRVAFVDGSNNVRLAGEKESSLEFVDETNAKQAPVTSADVDRDGDLEIVYVGNDDSKLKYVDDLLGTPTSKFLLDEDGKKIPADDNLGVVS